MREGYKESVLGEIPYTWEVKNLGELLEVNTGNKNAQDSLVRGKYPFFTRSVNTQKIDTYSYDTEALFIAGEGIFKVKYYKGKFDVHQRTYILTSKNDFDCSLKFLQNQIQSRIIKLVNTSVGSTVQSLRKPIIQELKLLIPSFPEQQKIAEILSTVDDKIDVIDQQISETQALKKGLMQRLLTKGIGHTEFKDSPLGKIPKSWDSSTIEKSCEIHNSKREPISAEIRKGMQGIYPYYGPTKAVDFINQYAFEGDYVLIGEDGDHFLKYENWSMTQFVHGKFNVNNHAHIVSGKLGCLTEWIYYFFQHRDIVKFLTRQGAGRYKLTKAALMLMILAVPPVEEQQKIASILSSVDEKLEVLEEKKTHYLELKQGLMQQLLTGKIRVKN